MLILDNYLDFFFEPEHVRESEKIKPKGAYEVFLINSFVEQFKGKT